MIGHAVLWEIIGADFFFAPARADLAAALRAIFFRFLALLAFEQPRAKNAQRSLFVLNLTAAILTTNDRSSWNVQNLHGGVGRVYALPARTTGARHFNS